MAVVGWESQTTMLQVVWSEVWRLRVRNFKLICCRRIGLKCGGCGLGISNFSNMFQAIWSEMWRLRVGYLTAGPGAEGKGASLPSQMLHLPCLPVSCEPRLYMKN